MRRRAFIKPAAGAETCIVKCCRHVVSFFQSRFQPAHPLRISVLPWRDAHHAAKSAFELVRAHANRDAQSRESDRRFSCAARFAMYARLNLAANTRDSCGSCINRILRARAAAQARTEAFF